MSLQPDHETAARNEGFNIRLVSSVCMDQEKNQLGFSPNWFCLAKATNTLLPIHLCDSLTD
ncbi:hypothetical protein [Enterococcus casseliflavus]|uniref:hypothetical protein n=1 Tax=Enterococcus casseliflavus TaxID=37734 RepID=UPI001C48D87C|nr:hypothetical protein [Enterococcus casseliflavus]MBV6375143.1 hypothetical protein [Enterococcus casseliflavus]